MFKKILFLILLVPVAHSEILELTCEVPMPIHIVYDFEKKEGYINMPSRDYFLDKGGKRPISKVEIKGDYYIFHNKTIHEVTVNRITLRATLDVVMGVASRFQFVSGLCEKGLKTYDKYQI